MILNIEDNIVNTNNIAILRKEVHINTNHFISSHDYYIAINGAKIKFNSEEERDRWFSVIKNAMVSDGRKEE